MTFIVNAEISSLINNGKNYKLIKGIFEIDAIFLIFSKEAAECPMKNNDHCCEYFFGQFFITFNFCRPDLYKVDILRLIFFFCSSIVHIEIELHTYSNHIIEM